jgi:hypothetical protein
MDENNTQRDYDKNPIVIQDYNTLFLFIIQIPIILFIIFMYIFNPYGNDLNRFNFLIVIPLMMAPYIKDYFNARNKRKIVLSNENITFYQEDKIIEHIDIDKITEIKKTYSDVYHKSQVRNQDFAVVSAFVFVPLFGYYTGLLLEFTIIFLLMHFYNLISKVVFQIYNNKKLPFKIFDAIIIFENDKFINILPTNELEYTQVRNYLLDKNLGKIENKKIYFEPVFHMYEKIEL